MEIAISINAQDVFNNVYVITGQAGKGLDNVDKFAATEDEEETLLSFLKESAAELGVVVSRFGTAHATDTSVEVDLSMPSNWKSSVETNLSETIEGYLTNKVASKWFATNNRDDVSFYSEKATSDAEDIVILLYQRTKPIRS